MYKTLIKPEKIESATEVVLPSRYVVVPTLFGHDFAPEERQRADFEITRTLPASVNPAQREMRSRAPAIVVMFWAILVTVIVFAIDASQLAY